VLHFVAQIVGHEERLNRSPSGLNKNLKKSDHHWYRPPVTKLPDVVTQKVDNDIAVVATEFGYFSFQENERHPDNSLQGWHFDNQPNGRSNQELKPTNTCRWTP
jgi:hypothetical protein